MCKLTLPFYFAFDSIASESVDVRTIDGDIARHFIVNGNGFTWHGMRFAMRFITICIQFKISPFIFHCGKTQKLTELLWHRNIDDSTQQPGPRHEAHQLNMQAHLNRRHNDNDWPNLRNISSWKHSIWGWQSFRIWENETRMNKRRPTNQN